MCTVSSLIQASSTMSLALLQQLIPQKKAIDLKVNENRSILAKQRNLLIYIGVFFKRCIVVDQTTTHN